MKLFFLTLLTSLFIQGAYAASDLSAYESEHYQLTKLSCLASNGVQIELLGGGRDELKLEVTWGQRGFSPYVTTLRGSYSVNDVMTPPWLSVQVGADYTVNVAFPTKTPTDAEQILSGALLYHNSLPIATTTCKVQFHKAQ